MNIIGFFQNIGGTYLKQALFLYTKV